jgi:RNA polymerase sigma-70 factor (ECF subfamily)
MAAPGDTSDEMLMIRYQRGDRQAFATLLRRYSRPLHNFALRQLRDPALAEDVTQEAFLKLVKSAAEFKHEARFSTWLYTITRNLCIDQMRRASHRRHASLDQPSGTHDRVVADTVADQHPAASAERSAVGSEMKSCIVRAVDGLPEEQREVFLLREVAHLRFSEIAVVTGVPENTVKSRMRYALERLRDALADFEDYARALR